MRRSTMTRSFIGLSYLKAGISSKFYNCSYSMEFTWEMLWMQIRDILLLQLHELNSVIREKKIMEEVII